MFSNVVEFEHEVGPDAYQEYPMYYAYWKIGIKGTNDDLDILKQGDEQVDDAQTGFADLSLSKKKAKNGTRA